MKRNVIIGFFVGMVTTAVIAVGFFKKILGEVVKSRFMLEAIKDSWIDLFIKLLYGYGTDEFMRRRTRKYYSPYTRSYQWHHPTYTDYRTWRDVKREDDEWRKNWMYREDEEEDET